MGIFLFVLVLPLLLFDGQLLWNYGFFTHRHMCEERLPFESRQFQRARRFPLDLSTIPFPYRINYIRDQPITSTQCEICLLWNIVDTFLYAILPFLVILVSSMIIIIKICHRRRSTLLSGGMCHTDRRILARQDHLSILLILINCLYLIMTGPLNICLIIQTTIKHFLRPSWSMRIFQPLNEYLRTLQNAYHALSFLFYCVSGEKFRKSSASISRRLLRNLTRHASDQSSMIFEHPWKRTITSTSNQDNPKRLPMLVIPKSCRDNRNPARETYL